MPLRSDIGPWLDCIQQTLDRIVQAKMEVVIGPFALGSRCFRGQFSEQSVVDRYRHGKDPRPFPSGERRPATGDFRSRYHCSRLNGSALANESVPATERNVAYRGERSKRDKHDDWTQRRRGGAFA
jgi:hypothetical protein